MEEDKDKPDLINQDNNIPFKSTNFLFNRFLRSFDQTKLLLRQSGVEYFIQNSVKILYNRL